MGFFSNPDLFRAVGLEFYLDMDGVLVDFDKEFQKHMPGLTEDDDWKWEDLHVLCPDIYLIADPMQDFKELYTFVKKHSNEVNILTAIPRRWNWPDVTHHKRAWAAKHLGMADNRVKFGPYAEDKQFHCVRATQVLIDDKIRNIEQWIARGGVGIHHVSAKDTIAQLQELGL